MVNCIRQLHRLAGRRAQCVGLLRAKLRSYRLASVVSAAVLSFASGHAVAEDIEIYLGQSIASQSEDGTATIAPLPGSAYLQNYQYGTYVHERGVGAASALVEDELVNNHKVLYEYHTGSWTWMPDFDRRAAASTGTLSQINLNPADLDSRYGLQFTAVLRVPADDNYTFYLNSVDGSQLYINGVRVVDNNGVHGLQERSATTWLAAGDHNVMVNYFNRNGDASLAVEWSSASLERQSLNDHLIRLPNYNALNYEYFEGTWNALPDFNSMTPLSTGRVHNFTLAARDQDQQYGFRFTGRINAPADGSYEFFIGSDDGSKIWIDGSLVVDNDGLHGYRVRSNSVLLTEGEHDIEVWFFEKHGGDNLTVKWTGPVVGTTQQDVATWLVGGPSDIKVTIDSFRYQPSFLHENGVLAMSDSLPEYWELHHVGATEDGETIVTIEAADSGLVLLGGDGTVSAVSPGDGDAYHWVLQPQADGTFVFVNRGNDYYLDGWNETPITFSTGGYEEQKWYLTPAIISDTPNLITHLFPRDWEFEVVSETADGNQVVRIRSKESLQYAATDFSGSQAENAYPQVGADSDALWEFIPQATNRYHIRNVTDGRYLHAAGPASSNNLDTVDGVTGTWVHCASENGSCTFTGEKTVRYGANSQYATGTYTDGVACANSVFGDPIHGVRKSCEYLDNSGADLDEDALWRIIPTSVSDNIPPPPDPAQPNILFVLDGSGSMGYTDSGEKGTRMERMKDALQLVMDNIEDVNVGLMRFSHSGSGGRIVYPVAAVDKARNDLAAIANTMTPSGGTPTVGALYEAARYYRGENVEFGKQRGSDSSSYNLHYSRVSHPHSYSGGTLSQPDGCTSDNLDSTDCVDEEITGSPVYVSPIVSECQANYVVMLTDGEPVSTAVTEAESLIGYSCDPTNPADGQCGEELAQYLNDNDQRSDMNGTNNVSTHTIGFNFTAQWLKDVAKAGGGEFFTANSALDLLTAIEAIVLEAKETENTIVAPAATLDLNSRLAHRDDIYLALFEPSYSPAWRGNLKRYFFDGEIKDNSSPRKNAIDPDTGTFVEGAQSYWSTAPDGAEVGDGGAASRLNKDSRKTTTYFPGNSTSLFNSQNALNINNVLAADLALPDDNLELTVDDRDQLLRWASGVDVLDFDEDGDKEDSRQYIGDPLHSTPVLMTYDWTTSEENSVIFFGTNEGFIHAIDTTTGDEIFSFIPEVLLTNLKHRFVDKPGHAKVYGMDGPITLWSHDADQDRVIGTGDHAYIYAGMRRGGNQYYALDVTDRTDPRYKWHIAGGSGAFAELGQTWSKPQLTRLVNPQDGKPQDVLVFGGGYDPQQDDVSVRTADSVGRAIFIVDAKTGSLIWRGGSDILASEVFPQMQYSIPSDVKVIDLNGDGLMDQMYVGDMGGQLWRFDVDNTAAYLSDMVSGGVIANLADDTPEGNRRFYSAPDLSVVSKGGKRVLVASIGSGYRAHPLDNVIDDRFFVVQQPDYLNGAPAGYGIDDGAGGYAAVIESDLYDVTDNTIGEGNTDEQLAAIAALEKASGWFLELKTAGEKSLSSSITVNSQVIFTTYTPVRGSNPCSPDIGTGRVYVMNLLDGTPSQNLFVDENESASDPYTEEDRSEELARAGIPPSPRVLFPENGEPTLLIGPEEGPSLDLGNLAKRVSWVEVP